MGIRGEFRVDPDCLNTGEGASDLEVVIPYTGPETATAALARAAALTAGLNARIRLLAVQTMPYPVPFVSPSVVCAHLGEQLAELASHSTLMVKPQVVPALDRIEGFKCALKPGSTVLVASHRHVWRTEEEKLARALAEAGHKVALFDIA